MLRELPRLGLVLWLSCLSSCEPDSGPERDVTSQALILPFEDAAAVTGSAPLAHLGAVISPCPGGGYVAGAPGDLSVWVSPIFQRKVMQSPMLASGPPTFPVGCQGEGSGFLRALVGGPDFASSVLADGGVSPLTNFRVDSFAVPPPASNSPLAVGNVVTGTVTFYRPAVTSLVSPVGAAVLSTSGFGSSLAWNQGGLLVVGNPQATSVSVVGTLTQSDGGFLQGSLIPVQNPEPSLTGTDFGRVVLTGDVTPLAGEEVIVSAPAVGRVYIFSGTVHSLTLKGGASFGAALAVDPRDLGGGLHALWVGEPNAARVHRYVGTAGTAFPAPNALFNSKFGAALAVDPQGVVAVGAPLYTDSLVGMEVGAVFEAIPDAGVLVGVPSDCVAGLSCALTNCFTGVCLGSVFCEKVVDSGCSVGLTCVANQCVSLDAGSGDAGSVDAGSVDAGSTDAGSTDAGSTDAGSVDAGSVDAGSTDAGSTDAGSSDAGGDTDAGQRTDAGDERDAGTDAGVAAESVPLLYSTSGCSTGGLPGLLLGLLLARRRR